jgi:hypothetical protein
VALPPVLILLIPAAVGLALALLLQLVPTRLRARAGRVIVYGSLLAAFATFFAFAREPDGWLSVLIIPYVGPGILVFMLARLALDRRGAGPVRATSFPHQS